MMKAHGTYLIPTLTGYEIFHAVAVQPGRYADLVATASNPLDNPGQFEQVSLVMKGGIVYRRDGAPSVVRVD